MLGGVDGAWEWALPRGWLGGFLVQDKGVFVHFHTLCLPNPRAGFDPHPQSHQARAPGKESSCNVLGSRVEWGRGGGWQNQSLGC